MISSKGDELGAQAFRSPPAGKEPFVGRPTTSSHSRRPEKGARVSRNSMVKAGCDLISVSTSHPSSLATCRSLFTVNFGKPSPKIVSSASSSLSSLFGPQPGVRSSRQPLHNEHRLRIMILESTPNANRKRSCSLIQLL